MGQKQKTEIRQEESPEEVRESIETGEIVILEIGSADGAPAPLRMVLGSQVLSATIDRLEERLADYRRQTALAHSFSDSALPSLLPALPALCSAGETGGGEGVILTSVVVMCPGQAPEPASAKSGA